MSDAEPFRQEVTEELGRLVELSTDLRLAMLARDPEKILEVVSRGEGLRLSPALLAAPPEVLKDEQVGRVARRLRRLQESNRLLASSFRKLYRQILKPADSADSGVYGRAGWVEGPVAGPLLIHQVG